MFKKGIILAGGLGTRLYPLTKIISKQLLPVYDKPMIYYPLSVLMKLKIKEINIISDKINIFKYKELFGDGKRLGINIIYSTQKKPKGIAQSILISEKFIDKSSCVLILGDNLFFGKTFDKTIIKASRKNMSTIFLKKVSNPNRYGVAKIENKKLTQIIEKPKKYISNLAVTGLYFYTNDVVRNVKKINFSKRGELEITDLNNLFIKQSKMQAKILNKEVKWFDAGTFDSLLEASKKISKFQKDNKTKIGHLEEIALKNRWIKKKDIKELMKKYTNNLYF